MVFQIIKHDSNDSFFTSGDFPKIENIISSKGIMKILVILSQQEELHITAIAKLAKLSHTTVTTHLNKLKDFRLIQEKQFGKIRVFRLRIEVNKINALKNFILYWNGKKK